MVPEAIQILSPTFWNSCTLPRPPAYHSLLFILPNQLNLTNALDECDDRDFFELYYDRVWIVNAALGRNRKWISSIPCSYELFLILYRKEYNHQIDSCIQHSWGLTDLLYYQHHIWHINYNGATTWLILWKAIVISSPCGFYRCQSGKLNRDRIEITTHVLFFKSLMVVLLVRIL